MIPRYRRFPHPPPPGVSMRRASPAATGKFAFAATFTRCVPRRLSSLSSCQPVRSARPPIGKNRDITRSEEFDLTHDAVAAHVLSGAARIAPHFVATNPQRILALKRFDGRVPTVGHVRVHSAFSWPSGRSAHAAGNRFVVSERPVETHVPSAERKVVH